MRQVFGVAKGLLGRAVRTSAQSTACTYCLAARAHCRLIAMDAENEFAPTWFQIPRSFQRRLYGLIRNHKSFNNIINYSTRSPHPPQTEPCSGIHNLVPMRQCYLAVMHQCYIDNHHYTFFIFIRLSGGGGYATMMRGTRWNLLTRRKGAKSIITLRMLQ